MAVLHCAFLYVEGEARMARWLNYMGIAWIVMVGTIPVHAQTAEPVPEDDTVEDSAEVDADTDGEDATDQNDSDSPAVDVTTSRVVDAQQEDLEREQRELLESEEAEARQASGGVHVIGEPIEDDIGHDYSSDNREHAQMVALRVGVSVPYLFAIKYTDGSPCESADPATEPDDFCSRLAEPLLDLEIAYSFTNKIELGAYVSLALTEDDAALAKPRIFGIGVRGYTSEQAIVKGFFGARVVLDLTNSSTAGFDDFDFGLRGEFGIQIEPVRWIGIWLGGAVSIRLLRNFTFLPEVGGGVQFRFP